MVQASDPAPSVHNRWAGGTSLLVPASGRILVDAEMRPVLVEVGQILAKQPPKVSFVPDDHVVEDFPSRRSHHPLGHSVGESCRMHQMGADRRDVSV
jgi:hypothetical protein